MVSEVATVPVEGGLLTYEVLAGADGASAGDSWVQQVSATS